MTPNTTTSSSNTTLSVEGHGVNASLMSSEKMGRLQPLHHGQTRLAAGLKGTRRTAVVVVDGQTVRDSHVEYSQSGSVSI